MAQTLETLILINAKMGDGFSQVGSTLRNLGDLINQVSQPLLEFGKESLNVYREYEMSLADAEVALSTTYGRNSQQLKRVMSDLDEAATEWAASTIFHTNDVGNAISEMAHAGWDYEQIISGMPAAMELAQAGSLDLSEAVNYIVKSTNAAGIEFDGLQEFVDHWTYSANSSSTTIGEMGDAMLRMGATMKFAGDQDNFLVMLATLADAGTVGSDAGTLLRNSMLRLVAPTEKASDVMEELGFTADEMAEAMDDTTLIEASKALEQVGFSAYTEKGELKQMPEIFHDLASALDEIPTDKERKSILSTIFPTRSISGALALLEGARNDWDGLLGALQDGSADGYGGYAASRMMDTLNGSIEIFESKVERLKQVVGGELSEDVRSFLEPLGGFVDGIANLDDASFGALVGGLEAIAVAGPGLLIAGAGLKFIGGMAGTLKNFFSVLTGTAGIGSTISGIAGGLALLAVAGFAARKVLDEIYEADYESKFGSVSLDGSKISAFADGIKQAYEEATSTINELKGQYDEAVQTFADTSGNFTSELMTKITTGTLSADDKNYFETLGTDMYNALQDGINAAHEEQAAALTQVMGNEFGENGGVFAQLMNIIAADMEADIATAEDLGRQLSEAITRGFTEGFTPENMAAMREAMQGMADELAEQRSAENNKKIGEALYRARTLGIDGVMESAEIISQVNLDENAKFAGDLWNYYKQQEKQWNEMIESGALIDEVYTSGERAGELTGRKVRANAEQRDYSLGVLRQSQEDTLNELALTGNNSLMDLLDNGLIGSGLSEAYKFAQGMGADFRTTGQPSAAQLNDFNQMGWDADQLRDYMGYWVDKMGGADALQSYIDTFERNGDSISAGRYRGLLDAYNAVNMRPGEEAQANVNNATGDYSGVEQTPEAFATRLESEGFSKDILSGMVAGGADFASTLGGELYTQLGDIASGFGASVESAIGQIVGTAPAAQEAAPAESYVNTDFAAYGMQQEPIDIPANIVPETVEDVEPVEVSAEVQFDTSSVMEYPEPVSIMPRVEGVDPMELLGSQGVDVQVNGDTTELSASIQAEDFQALMAYVDGDTSQLSGSITSQDGRIITTFVDGNTANLQAAINSVSGQTVTVYLEAVKTGDWSTDGGHYASGGRATSASIFGEAGPEWAIPEEHSERTAQLLNAAREASGFTWPELLARFGGLNANPNNSPATVIYSPTINATDASGVDDVLREDKGRLERWFRERQMIDSMEVYA